MSDVEFESFEITDQDLLDEFNPNRRRPKITKNQHIYGIWAREEDYSEQDRPSFARKDYSNPINFVGGGIQQAGKKVEKKEDEDDEEENEIEISPGSSSEEELNSRPSFKPTTPKRNMGKVYQISEDQMKANPTWKVEILKCCLTFTKDEPAIDQLLASNKKLKIGGWERHTKGIGQKLLLQMGYQPGKGLGKDLQGISAPIEAKQRKGRGAIGRYGAEHKQKPAAIPIQEEEIEDDEQMQLRQWKKKPEEGKKKVKYIYRTAADVIADGGTKKVQVDTSELSKVKVIDMTGPEQRVFSGYHAIHKQHSKPTELDDERTSKKFKNFELPELMHNLNLLLEMTEQDIIRNDRELRYHHDQVVNVSHEKTKQSHLLEQEEQQIKTLQEVLKVIDSIENRTKEGSDDKISLSETAAIFRKLQDEFYEEYKMYELNHLAVGIVFPQVKEYFKDWQPLKDRNFGLEVIKEWKDVLEQSTKQTLNSSEMDVYHRLIWDIWMPFVRTAILSWNVRDCDPVIELLENWMPLLPPWILDNILDQLIMPRLHQEVEQWNPLTDTMPIHAWIHPWLPLMGTRLEPLYAPIRHKLANAMLNWHPSDQSAKMILQPWVNVFPRGVLEGFVVKNILPKLTLCLQEFIINPHQQHLEPWHWVMAWEDFLPLSSLVSLLEKFFFPKWLHVLCSWLEHNPNYDEVTQWYMGWKSMLSDQLTNHPVVKEQFTRALDIMNRAVSLGYQPGAKEHFAYLASLEQQREMETAQMNRNYEGIMQGIRSGGSSAANMTLTFKDLIERRAEEMGLLFMPIPNRFQEAKQVYRLGRILIYIDRGVIFVQSDQTWQPKSLQAAFDMAAI